MSNPNDEQIEYWNGSGGERFAAHQEFIDRGLAPITDAAIRFADPKEGERVLDIGCGSATTTLLLRQMVGPAGAAAGVDVSVPLLNVARARTQAANADVAFVEADASRHEFQPVFDLVFSRFGVMFFADPVQAFANIRKAIAPGGRLAFVCWRTLAENGWTSIPMEAAREFLPPMEMPEPDEPGPFAFGSGDRVRMILERTGFRDVRVEKLDSVMRMGKSADDAATEALNLGSVSRAAAEMDETMREKIRGRIRTALEKFQTSEGIAAPAACWLAGGRV